MNTNKDFGTERIRIATTNCYGFVVQLVNTLPWKAEMYSLPSFHTLREMIRTVDLKTLPVMIVMTCRLRDCFTHGHAFALEYHPIEKMWYLFQSWASWCPPVGIQMLNPLALISELERGNIEVLKNVTGLSSPRSFFESKHDASRYKWTSVWFVPECPLKAYLTYKKSSSIQPCERVINYKFKRFLMFCSCLCALFAWIRWISKIKKIITLLKRCDG